MQLGKIRGGAFYYALQGKTATNLICIFLRQMLQGAVVYSKGKMDKRYTEE